MPSLGRVGVWTPYLSQVPWSRGRDVAAELESLGYAALWLPEAFTQDVFVAATLVLGATDRLVAASGITSIYARDPVVCNAAWQTLGDAYPDRFILGLGVSHQPMVEGVLGTTYGPPVAAMANYLERMDNALYFATKPSVPPRRVLAALGPRMLALARDSADGAHPYNVTPEHTKLAREVLGPDKLLAVEQMVALTTDAAAARELARNTLRVYIDLPNYANNWRRLGFTDFTTDAFLDAMVAWGDEDAIRVRVQEHLDAGADHVCVQVLDQPLEGWRRLAPALQNL